MNKEHIAIVLFTVSMLLIGIAACAIWWNSGVSANNAQQTPSTSVRTYSNELTTPLLAQELGIPEASIISVIIGAAGAGCSVTFTVPITVHQDEFRNLQGQNIITQRSQDALDPFQLRRLDELMETQGCLGGR